MNDKNKNVLMPKSVALWLKTNTKISYEQIAEFCDISTFMLESLTPQNTQPHNPIFSHQLKQEEIDKAEKDINHKLQSNLDISKLLGRKKSKKYIPIVFKNRKVPMIVWFFRQLNEKQYNDINIIKKIARALNSTSNFIQKTFNEIITNPKNFQEIINPVQIGICSFSEIDQIFKP